MRTAPRIHRGSLMHSIALGFGALAFSLALAQEHPQHGAAHATQKSQVAAKNATGALTTYGDLPSFLAAIGDLGTPTLEDFEHGFAQYLPQTQFAACIEPVSQESNDACYQHGDLVSGIHIASTNARGVIVMNPGIYTLPSRTIGAWPYRLNSQSYTEVRFDDPPTAVAADVYGFAMGDGAVPTNVVPVQVDVYDGSDNLIGTFQVESAAYNVSSFAGFTSTIPVARVVYGTHVDYSAGPIDNLRFAGGAGRLDTGTADFGPVAVGDTLSMSFELTNAGHLALSIGQLPAPSAPFSFVSDACSNSTLAPATSCTVQVAFAPSFESDFDATVAVPSNDPASPTAWSLKGTGVVALAGRSSGGGR